MREVILIFSYISCAFIPALFYVKVRRRYSMSAFWAIWIFSLIGAFLGGYFGTMLIARAGLELGFPGSLGTGLAGAWLMAVLFIKLKEIPGNW
jgi:hypothetical protein